MFSGKAYHTIDAKGRLFIPAMYREELGNSFIVAKGFTDPYLIVYPQSEWETFIEKVDELGLDKEQYGFYLDLRKYGSTHHSGFGLGFERCVMYLTGMGNIRDVIPFPRTVKNCDL